MARRIVAGLALLAATVVGGEGLQAQTIPSPYRHIESPHALSLLGGYLDTDRGEMGTGVASGPLLGLQYTGRFAGPVAGVVRVWGMSTERAILSRDATNAEAEPAVVDETSSLLTGGEVGLRLLVTGPRTWRSLAPFVEVTGGLLAVAGSRTDVESELPSDQIVDYGPAFAVGTALGTDWFLTDRISVNVAGRGLLWRLTVPEGLTGNADEDSEWTRNFGVTVGAAFHF